MIKFPGSLQELEDFYSSDEVCREFLANVRWKSGYCCPKCAARENFWITKRGLRVCRTCNFQCSPLAKTLFDKTRTPLPIWLKAIWFCLNENSAAPGTRNKDYRGRSAHGLYRSEKINRFETAYEMMLKVRSIFEHCRSHPLGQNYRKEIKVFVIPLEHILKPKKPSNLKVVVATEKFFHAQKKIRPIRMEYINSANPLEVKHFLHRHIANDTTITIYDQNFLQLARTSEHRAKFLMASDPKVLERDADILRVLDRLRHCLTSTYRGRVQDSHIRGYLHEVEFRMNYQSLPPQSRFRKFIFHAMSECK